MATTETQDGRLDVDVNGDLTYPGVYVCHGRLSVAGSIRVESLMVAVSVSATGDIVVTHGARIGGEVACAGRLQLSGDLIVAKGVSAADGIRVGGRVECGGQMLSGEDVTVYGDLHTAKGIDAAGTITTVTGNIACLSGEVRSRQAIVSAGRIHARGIAAGTTIAAGTNGGDGAIVGEILSGQVVLGTPDGRTG